MSALTVKLPEALDARLRAVAARRGVTRSDVVREALEVHLAEERAADGESFLALASDLVGCVEGPADLSTNPTHLQGFGE